MSQSTLARETSRADQTSASSPLELTILMPCLNEAETIEICVRKARGFLERSGVKGEVLIADNGSTDGSQALAEKEGARVVAVPEKGYGAALMGGIKAAQGRFVIMGDADDSYDFENLEGMVQHLRDGAELVMGNRFKGGIAPGAMPFLHKYLGNPVLSFIGRLFFKIPIGDFHCGLRGFSRASILDLGLQSPGMEFASEMVVKASLYDLRIEETPTTLKPDGRSRPPHLKTWRDGWRHLRFLLLHSPRYLFIYPGLALIVTGLVGGALLARGELAITPQIKLDIHSLVVACFAVLMGVQLVVFGALARRYQALEGVLPPGTFHKFLLGLSLEWILRAALVIFVGGVVGATWAVAHWAGSGFGPILYNDVMRVLVISLTGVAVAIQLAAAGFLASVFSLRR
ncbi:glycosyltransferase family 2 protein [Phenylobacterium montanum]|uniref:Glycosyltransferase family 2 protein n=1 Tax=Phenylobacterium montanum TaxID=2823693 RepID=A0A975FYZ3_9CAUL|nr:glycosyltransferase family 2 protein [Caulobacter sp. S6]QUD87850.1 glycosyltransferase family 2 protein [Caulobacter sp. S6]